jgi:hypothetical protein
MATLTPAAATAGAAVAATHARHPFRCSDTKIKCSDHVACSDSSGCTATVAAAGSMVAA